MGRYNNKRTQAAAEALKNTPSRARFSKGPPRRNTKSNNNKKPSNNNKNGGGGGRGRNTSTTAATARVIDKIQNRQQQQQQNKPRVASTEEALKLVDKSKYDEIKLPEDI
eukprot:scaffold13655_cov52-Cylindrotheca_fusiformis.AAC.1